MRNPKILVFDIETSPMEVYAWGLKDQNIGLSQIKTDWRVIAWAAKWLNEPKSTIKYMDQRSRSIANDRPLLEVIWDLLDMADIVITQNGRNFDSKKLNARFIEHGMTPPSPYQHLDTYQIVKKVAKFSSNKLEYLTERLCTKYKKLTHKSFPGMSLWTECLKGNKKAWDAMKRYNIHDVLSTEELYNKVKGWTPKNMPESHSAGCPRCGSFNWVRRGFNLTKRGTFQRFQCQNCGGWMQGEKESEC